jgi:hypothetical protein
VNSYWTKAVTHDNVQLAYNVDQEFLASWRTTVTLDFDSSGSPAADRHFRIADYVFYFGTVPVVAGVTQYYPWDGTLAGAVSAVNGANLDLAMEFVSTDSGSPVEEYTLYIWSDEAVTVFTVSDVTFTAAITVASVDLIAGATPRFIIVPNSVTAVDGDQIDISPYDPGTGADVTLARFLVEWDGVEYTLSMDRDDLDLDGVSIWAETINGFELPFTLIVLNEFNYDDMIAAYNYDLPKGIGYDKTVSSLSTNLLTAMNKHLDQEVEYLDFVSDFGDPSTAIALAQKNVGARHFALPVYSIPEGNTTKAQAEAYRAATGINDNNGIFFWPNDYSTARTGFKMLVGASTLYIELIGQKRAQGKEWSPAFSKNNGIVQSSKLETVVSKTDREALIDVRINSIAKIRSGNTNATIIFNNLTADNGPKKILSEDQNRRLHNRINRDVKILMEAFHSRYSTPTTWDDVEAVINQYFKENVMNALEYKPRDYKVICNASNNPTALQVQGKLFVEIRVQYQNSIKFITVLNRAYDVGVQI